MNRSRRWEPRSLSASVRDALRREAQDGASELEEYRTRDGINEFAASWEGKGTFDPTEAKGVISPTTTGPDEDTRTWGNSFMVEFFLTAFAGPTPFEPITGQLVHVSRRRPTTFTVFTVLTFIGASWAGENAFTLKLTYSLGVGQAQAPYSKLVAIPAPADGLQVVNTDTFPIHALQGIASLAGTAKIPGLHQAQISQFAAPVYA